MRGIVLQFLILFSVLCAGLHAPAAAHGDHADHGQPTIILADAHHADAHGDFSNDSSSDPSQELFHHHHCPAAMMFDCGPAADTILANREMLRPGKAAVLISRATAPTTEPPAA
jgi:hypothetical protein